MKIALVSIVKNEDDYLKEFVNYYIDLGFDHIYIYNDDSDNHPSLFLEKEIKEGYITIIEVIPEYIEINNKNVKYFTKYQNSVYSEAIKIYNEYDWLAFFDLDEFLEIKINKRLKELLNEYMDYPAIGINWVIYGANGQFKKESGTVIQRFKYNNNKEEKINPHIKTILQPKLCIENNAYFKYDPHSIISDNNNFITIDFEKNRINGPFNPKGTDNIAIINHFCTKSYEEFIKRCNNSNGNNVIKSKINLFFDINKDMINKIN